MALTAILASSVSASSAIVSNGSFEVIGAQTTIAGPGGIGKTQNSMGASWGVFRSLPNWTSPTNTRGIEIQTQPTLGLSPAQGSYYVELDSDPASGSGVTSNSSMTQVVNLAVGLYSLSFAYAPRTGNAGTNGIGLRR